MVSLDDYVGREQSYVKHVFLALYLERLAFKTASRYPHIVYVDGFAGPWQSASETFNDTSFGIASNALRRVKEAWKEKQREVRMSAFLVERDSGAYQQLARMPARYPDMTVRTYNDDFLKILPTILKGIPSDAFTFFLIDPKGWRIPLRAVGPLLIRRSSEVVFNFMLDFINRAASIRDPVVEAGLDELIPFGNWRDQLEEIERLGISTPDRRKAILVGAFGESLKKLGSYDYIAETTILRPLRDRPLYCLVYATRHPEGIQVFRDCQITALKEEARTRAAAKARYGTMTTGQGELFESPHEMASSRLQAFLENECTEAEAALLELTPMSPHFVTYKVLRANVLARHVVRHPDVNRIAARLYRENKLWFPDWQEGKRVPQASYRVQRA